MSHVSGPVATLRLKSGQVCTVYFPRARKNRADNKVCLSRAASQLIIKIWSTMFHMIFTAEEWRRVPATKALR